MSTPRRRSARLAGVARTRIAAPALSSVSEYHEAPENLPELPQESNDAAPSSPLPAPSTPASSAVKPPHDEMHPSKAHQSMGQPSSALRLGFSDIKPANKDGHHSGLPPTPSKIGVPATPFTFRVSREGTGTQLSGEAQRLLEELREQADRIKVDLVAQREAENAAAEGQDRKIAKAKGKSGRYSAAHMAEFKKMDSIENHASAWRAQAGRVTPLASALKRSPSKANLDSTPTSQVKAGLKRSPSKANLNTTPTSQVKPDARSASKPANEPVTPSAPRFKPSLKRTSSKANLDDLQQSPSPKKTAPPPSSAKPRIFANIDLQVSREQQRVPSKRFKQHMEDDTSTTRPVSRDGTSIPRPKSSGAGSIKAVPTPSGLARLSPTKASLTQAAAQGKPTISLVKSPSKSDLGKGLSKPPSLQSLTSSMKTSTPRARVISPGRFERVKSILRGHRTASGNVQTAIPQPTISQTPAPPKVEKVHHQVPLTTPRRKVTKHVAFTPEVMRMAREQDSPSPMKTMPKPKPLRTLDEDQFPSMEGVLAKAKSDEVVYPDLSGFRPLPAPPADKAADQPSVKPASVPGTFTFRSDHTIEFGGASASGFGGSAGQSSIRQVRQSIKPAAEMPGSFPVPPSPSSHPNKENKMPSLTKMIPGAAHGMSNKKRHRAHWDEEDEEDEEEQEDDSRAAKKRKNQHLDGEALFAPRLLGTTPKSSAKKTRAGRSVSATPGSASPTKKRGIISMSRLNMLARPKNRS